MKYDHARASPGGKSESADAQARHLLNTLASIADRKSRFPIGRRHMGRHHHITRTADAARAGRAGGVRAGSYPGARSGRSAERFRRDGPDRACSDRRPARQGPGMFRKHYDDNIFHTPEPVLHQSRIVRLAGGVPAGTVS
jgi:hypothetical protein